LLIADGDVIVSRRWTILKISVKEWINFDGGSRGVGFLGIGKGGVAGVIAGFSLFAIMLHAN